jgi:phage-related protein
MPYTKPIEGEKYKGLFELRIQQGGDISRIFYILPVGNQFILLHGFLKKGEKTPPSELNTALSYKKDYLRRFGDHENT